MLGLVQDFFPKHNMQYFSNNFFPIHYHPLCYCTMVFQHHFIPFQHGSRKPLICFRGRHKTPQQMLCNLLQGETPSLTCSFQLAALQTPRFVLLNGEWREASLFCWHVVYLCIKMLKLHFIWFVCYAPIKEHKRMAVSHLKAGGYIGRIKIL